jgi:Uma2 family endonuclease
MDAAIANGIRMLPMVITTSPLVKTYTLQEFWELPEPADYSKLELIKGVLYITPPPDFPHNEAVANLNDELRSEIQRCGYRGKVYVPRAAIWVDDDTYLEPDLMYISDELKAKMKPRHWDRADIVVEVTSPSTALYDQRTKADTYEAMGVRELWLVDTVNQQIEVRSFGARTNAIFKSGDAVRSQVLRKIRIPLADVFS